MDDPARRIRSYLDGDESVVRVFEAGSLGYPDEVSATVAITDRRVLYLAADGDVVHMPLAAICSVRSRSHTTRTYEGSDYRLLAGLGSLVLLLSLVGLMALPTPIPVLLLWVLAMAGALGVIGIHEHGERVTSRLTSQGFRTWDERERRIILGGVSGGLATLAVLGMVVIGAPWLVLATLAGVLGGVLLIGYAHRHREELTGLRVIRRETSEISIGTADGTTISFACDPAEEIERELASLAVEGARRGAQLRSLA